MIMSDFKIKGWLFMKSVDNIWNNIMYLSVGYVIILKITP